MMQLEKYTEDAISQMLNMHYQNGVRVRVACFRASIWAMELRLCYFKPSAIAGRAFNNEVNVDLSPLNTGYKFEPWASIGAGRGLDQIFCEL